MAIKKIIFLMPALGFGLLPASVTGQGTTTQVPAKSRPRVVTAADALVYFNQRDWARAVEGYEKFLAANPHDGQHWANYGFSLYSLQRYDEAIKAFEKQSELGYRPGTAIYNIACCHALAGRNDKALVALGKALQSGFDQEALLFSDTDLDTLRSDPRFKKLLGTAPEGLSRDGRWAYDLDYLVTRMERVHYNLYAKVSREKFKASVDELKSRLPSLKDEEIAVGIQSIIAQVGDGHTIVAFERRGTPTPPRYPVDLFLFKEGLFVRGAAPEYAEIVGSEVIRIGNATAEEALRKVGPICSRDNAMGVKLHSTMFLTHPAVLSYLKLADDMTKVTFEVKKPGGEVATVELKPVVLDDATKKAFVKANARATTPEPLSFKNNDDPFWFEFLPGKKLVYFQFNEVGNKPDETLEKFCGSLFSFVNENPVEYLVIDMRNNGGGNNTLNRPLIHGLIRNDKVNRVGHLFVLAGRSTFSAAMNCAVEIERNTNAIFAGEPTGSSPNFVGETTILRLPCSGLRLSCSSLYWQSSTASDRRTWISPGLFAEPSIALFAENRDPGLEAIFDYIESHAASN